jgi:type I restriction enzyme M protein
MNSQVAHSPPPITLSELESHLWRAANILRGSPVDRTDWKSYILPLLFFKRICDVWDEEHEAILAEYGEDFGDEHRFQVPEGCHWRDVRDTPTNVGTALQNSMRELPRTNSRRALEFPPFAAPLTIEPQREHLMSFWGTR